MLSSHKELIAFGLIILGIAGGAFFFRAPQSTGVLHEIILTEDGFTPETITINKGDTVRFSSTRGKPFWPASNLHPTHGIYPEFDPKEPLDPTDHWDFQFDRVGNWKLHDHLAPYYTGEIIVKDPGGISLKDSAPCEGKECRQDYLVGILRTKGLDAAMSELAHLYAKDPTFGEECHTLAHELGHSAYGILRKGELPLTPKTSFCSYGFYHGFMEGFVADYEDDLSSVRAFCLSLTDTFKDEAPDALMQCFHGVGHGAFRVGSKKIVKNELDALPTALSICERASATPLQLSRCTTGIYNTIGELYGTGEQHILPNKNDPLWICPLQPKQYQNACYISLNSALLSIVGNDIVKAALFVDRIEDTTTAAHTMLNVAAVVGASHLSSPRYTGVLMQCHAISLRLRTACIQGFAYGFLEHGEPQKEYVGALKVCSTQGLTEEEKNACFDYLFRYFKQWYSPEKGKEVCATLTSPLKEACLLIVEKPSSSQ